MFKMKRLLPIILISLVIIGCGGSPAGSEWITPEIDGDTVSIPVLPIENNTISNFKINTSEGEMDFMVYKLNNYIHVLANVCPPCGSVGFDLEDAELVCQSCGTTFDAETGEGIFGGCVNYPKESVPYELRGNQIVMNRTDLITAYQETLAPGY